jgi:hypothetical protein
MAVLIPERVPEHVRRAPGRGAEIEVYEALADTLDDDWLVFGWSSWVCKRSGGGSRDGEVDFVVAHPGEGALVIEVKGGAVSRDAVKGEWRSRAHTGAEHAIKDPFRQARDYAFKLRAKLHDIGLAEPERTVPGYAVVLPHSQDPGHDLGPDAPADVVLYHDDVPRIGERVTRCLRYWRGRDAPPGERAIAKLRDVLAKSFTLELPAAVGIGADARRIVELADEQFHVLDELARHRRVLVNGGPGTGKTILAIEKARRLAAVDEMATLLVCFNRPLAAHLASATAGVPRLTTRSFHQLCHETATRAGMPLPGIDDERLSNDFFRKDLPARLVDALSALPDRWDAIVLDEGQDFSEDDRAALEFAFADRDDRVFYVFQDASQAIYRDGSSWPEGDFVTRDLVVNHRNTRQIVNTVRRLGVATVTSARGPEGRPVETVEAAMNDEPKELSRVLHRLVREEEVLPGAIAVLVSSRSVIPELAPDGRIGAFQITSDPAPRDNRVLVESISRFKGLERDVVVLAGLREVPYLDFDALLCVGASRARAHLVVVGTADTLAVFRGA